MFARTGSTLQGRRGRAVRAGERAVNSVVVDPTFFCDAMLGGLSRWLRAAGYDAAYEYGIDDGVLVARAHESGRILLSSDAGIFERGLVRDGAVRALFVPRAMGTAAELGFVLGSLSLPLRDPRCMPCGGELGRVPKETVRDEAPPRTFERVDTFYRCGRCGKLLWYGTHWQRIARVLEQAVEGREG
jgi:hypothetical protein